MSAAILRIVLVALAFAGVAFRVTPASACSCGFGEDPFKGISALFTGTVIGIDQPGQTRFRVERSWKGGLPDEIVVKHDTDGAACGVGFAEGQRATVPIGRYQGAWSTDLCSYYPFMNLHADTQARTDNALQQRMDAYAAQVDSLGAAADAAPGDAAPLDALADFLEANNDFAVAATIRARQAALAVDDPEPLVQQAENVIRMGNFADALPAAEAALLRAPGQAAALRAYNFAAAGLGRSADLRGPGIDLSNRTLSNVALQNAKLAQADLRKSSFNRVDLSASDLTAADLREATWYESVLQRSDLRQTVLEDATVQSGDFTGADLRKAKFNRAKMWRSIFAGADLRDVSMRDAILNGVDFRGARLDGADFTGADLSSANLLGVDLSQAQLTGATLTDAEMDDATRLPPGIDAASLQASGTDPAIAQCLDRPTVACTIAIVAGQENGFAPILLELSRQFLAADRPDLALPAAETAFAKRAKYTQEPTVAYLAAIGEAQLRASGDPGMLRQAIADTQGHSDDRANLVDVLSRVGWLAEAETLLDDMLSPNRRPTPGNGFNSANPDLLKAVRALTIATAATGDAAKTRGIADLLVSPTYIAVALDPPSSIGTDTGRGSGWNDLLFRGWVELARKRRSAGESAAADAAIVRAAALVAPIEAGKGDEWRHCRALPTVIKGMAEAGALQRTEAYLIDYATLCNARQQPAVRAAQVEQLRASAVEGLLSAGSRNDAIAMAVPLTDSTARATVAVAMATSAPASQTGTAFADAEAAVSALSRRDHACALAVRLGRGQLAAGDSAGTRRSFDLALRLFREGGENIHGNPCDAAPHIEPDRDAASMGGPKPTLPLQGLAELAAQSGRASDLIALLQGTDQMTQLRIASLAKATAEAGDEAGFAAAKTTLERAVAAQPSPKISDVALLSFALPGLAKAAPKQAEELRNALEQELEPHSLNAPSRGDVLQHPLVQLLLSYDKAGAQRDAVLLAFETRTRATAWANYPPIEGLSVLYSLGETARAQALTRDIAMRGEALRTPLGESNASGSHWAEEHIASAAMAALAADELDTGEGYLERLAALPDAMGAGGGKARFEAQRAAVLADAATAMAPAHVDAALTLLPAISVPVERARARAAVALALHRAGRTDEAKRMLALSLADLPAHDRLLEGALGFAVNNRLAAAVSVAHAAAALGATTDAQRIVEPMRYLSGVLPSLEARVSLELAMADVVEELSGPDAARQRLSVLERRLSLGQAYENAPQLRARVALVMHRLGDKDVVARVAATPFGKTSRKFLREQAAGQHRSDIFIAAATALAMLEKAGD